MKTYLKQNVYEAAKERIKFLLDEFEDVGVSFSGGKDSTVIFGLLKELWPKDRGRFPVLFLDQEAEWNSTVEMVRHVMKDPMVKPMWVQCPIRLFNATSGKDEWLYCWKEGDEWIRPKEEVSIKDNVYGTDRFHKFFPAFTKYHWGGRKMVWLTGMRAQESLGRLAGSVSDLTYKDKSWGRRLDKSEEHYSMFPIYDWDFRDVWKYIHDRGLKYNSYYDALYRLGERHPGKMRVSNVHHETAVHSLIRLQEIDPVLYNAPTKRMSGIDTAGKAQHQFFITSLPYMFRSWKEYRDHLLENLIEDVNKEVYQHHFEDMDRRLLHLLDSPLIDSMHKAQCNSIVANDKEFTKLRNWEMGPKIYTLVRMERAKRKKA